MRFRSSTGIWVERDERSGFSIASLTRNPGGRNIGPRPSDALRVGTTNTLPNRHQGRSDMSVPGRVSRRALGFRRLVQQDLCSTCPRRLGSKFEHDGFEVQSTRLVLHS